MLSIATISLTFWLEYLTHEQFNGHDPSFWEFVTRDSASLVFVTFFFSILALIYERLLRQTNAVLEAVPITKKVSKLDESKPRFKCVIRSCRMSPIAVIEGDEEPKPVCDMHLVQHLLAEPALEAQLVASLAMRFAEPSTLTVPAENTIQADKHCTFMKVVWALVLAQLIFLSIFVALWRLGLGTWFRYR